MARPQAGSAVAEGGTHTHSHTHTNTHTHTIHREWWRDPRRVRPRLTKARTHTHTHTHTYTHIHIQHTESGGATPGGSGRGRGRYARGGRGRGRGRSATPGGGGAGAGVPEWGQVNGGGFPPMLQQQQEGVGLQGPGVTPGEGAEAWGGGRRPPNSGLSFGSVEDAEAAVANAAAAVEEATKVRGGCVCVLVCACVCVF